MTIISVEIMKIIDEREMQTNKKNNKDRKEQGGQKL